LLTVFIGFKVSHGVLREWFESENWFFDILDGVIAHKVQIINKETDSNWCGKLTEDTPPTDEKLKTTSSRPDTRAFNPLVNYLFYTIAVVIAYVLFWGLGYPAVIAMMMFFVIQLIRDTVHVYRTYEYKFAGQASVVNLIYSMTFFIILVVNGFAISQQMTPPILPTIADLTSWTPLFIMGGVFGMANIKKMWGPVRSVQF